MQDPKNPKVEKRDQQENLSVQTLQGAPTDIEAVKKSVKEYIIKNNLTGILQELVHNDEQLKEEFKRHEEVRQTNTQLRFDVKGPGGRPAAVSPEQVNQYLKAVSASGIHRFQVLQDRVWNALECEAVKIYADSRPERNKHLAEDERNRIAVEGAKRADLLISSTTQIRVAHGCIYEMEELMAVEKERLTALHQSQEKAFNGLNPKLKKELKNITKQTLGMISDPRFSPPDILMNLLPGLPEGKKTEAEALHHSPQRHEGQRAP